MLFHLELISELPNTAVAPGTAVSEVNLTPHFDNEEIDGTIVRMTTDLGVVDVELFAQTLLLMTSAESAQLLVRFLVALPIGALVGGLLAARCGEKWVSAA